MTVATKTTLSKNTLDILKNFSSINSNILVKPGNVLTTISPVKNVMSEATVEETFETEFGIWDLNKFLGTVSLFDKPEFEFEDKFVRITNGNKKSEVVYYYSQPSLLTTVNKKINMPDSVVSFQLKATDFVELQKASSVLQLPDLTVRSDGKNIQLTVLDKSDTTTNTYSINVGELPDGDHEFNFYFKVENLKMISGDYNVEISEKVVSQFTHTTEDLKYWVALESDSTYNG